MKRNWNKLENCKPTIFKCSVRRKPELEKYINCILNLQLAVERSYPITFKVKFNKYTCDHIMFYNTHMITIINIFKEF